MLALNRGACYGATEAEAETKAFSVETEAKTKTFSLEAEVRSRRLKFQPRRDRAEALLRLETEASRPRPHPCPLHRRLPVYRPTFSGPRVICGPADLRTCGPANGYSADHACRPRVRTRSAKYPRIGIRDAR